MDSFLRSKLTALNADHFKRNANEEFLSDEAKNLQKTANDINFIPKGYSKKTQAYKNIIKETRQNNYSAKWYEDGWYFGGKEPRNLINFYYTSKPDKGQNWFYKRNQLPYTDETSTGVYFDVEWSGLENYFPVSGENSLSNMVLGGFIGTKYDKETFVFPYRNFNEFFDHKNIQLGDMGHKMFYDQINRYIPGEPIGYNRIFFEKGLSKENIDQNTNVIVLSHSKDGLPFSARGINIETTGTLDNRKWFKRFESQNVPRFDVFFYSGNLHLTSTPRGEARASYFGYGYGPIIQLGNPIYSQLTNNNFSLLATGVYPEFLNKTFCCYNTGIETEEFYLSVDNSNVLEIFDTNKANALSPLNRPYYIWTDEDSGNKSGQFIRSYLLGRNSNRNFNVKINTKSLNNFTNQIHTEYINIYRVTGAKFIPGSNYNGMLTEKFRFPVNIYAINNGTKITYTGFSEKNKSGQNMYTNLGFRPFILTQSGIIDKKNNNFTIRFYSTGENIKSPVVRNDIFNRINKLGVYSGQNIKHIYPIESGEAYLNSYTDSKWIKLFSNENRNFKWFRDGDDYLNDPLGNLKCEFTFKTNSRKMLPNFVNLTGRNYIVQYDQLTNKFLFNESQDLPKIFKNVNYRFLFTNFSDNNFTILNDSTKIFSDYKVYEPEYNKVLKNYKLIQFRLRENSRDNLFWSGNINNTSITGEFEVVNNTNSNPYYFSSGIAEYFVYNICPSAKTEKNYFIPGSGQLKNAIENSIFTEYHLNKGSTVNFYPHINKTYKIINYKDDPVRLNPCRRTYDNFNKRFWYLMTETELGCVSGCYSDEEFLKIIDNQYATKKTNVAIDLMTGKYYHFIRPASTEKEINNIQLEFLTWDQNSNQFKQGISGVTINRETHVNNPNYLATTLGDFDTKYFDHIYFYVSPQVDQQKQYAYGLKYNLNSGQADVATSLIYIQNNLNESYAPIHYTGILNAPVFSGNLKFITSDLDKGEINIPLILSGNNGFDHLRF